MRFHPRRPSAALVVSIVALVVALGGTAFAGPVAQIAKQISGSSIKAHSISGNRLKNNTLTGTQIMESKLGTVPSALAAATAKSADTANSAKTATTAVTALNAVNAGTLGGLGPSGYVASSKMLRFAFTMAKTDAAKTIGTFGPFTFTATCAPGAGTNVHAQITAKTSTAHSYLKATTINADMATTDTVSVVDVDSSGANANDVQYPVAFDPTGTVSVDGGDGFGAYVNTAGGNDCRFFGHILNDAG